jgi:heme-degrading monooxygenase HmoA
MIVRIWTVGIAAGKAGQLERFANETSLPMFRKQPGCLGVLFTRSEETCATITIWDRASAIEALDSSTEYQSVVRAIEDSGILAGEHNTESFAHYGGFIDSSLVE